MKTTFKLLIIIAVLTAACKNGNKAVAEDSKKTTKVEQKVEEKANPKLESKEQVPESETKAQINRTKNKLSDSLVVRIERTACFGRCPIYTASIYKSGFVLYQGEKWVEKEGLFQSKVSDEKINAIIKKAEAIGFFKMNESYDSPYVTDLPSTIVTIRGKEMVKIVANRYQGPEELAAFEIYIDKVLNELVYKPHSLD